MINKDDHALMNYYFNNEIAQWDVLKEDIQNSKVALGNRGIVELMVRIECNQKCEYCYLYKYGNELHPKEMRATKEEIIQNLKSLLDYMLSNQQYQPAWELFAGDMFGDNLWFDIMDLFYDYFLYIRNNVPDWDEVINQIREKGRRGYPSVTMPCNLAFVLDEEKRNRVDEYIDKFQHDLDVNIGFTYSTDGIFATDTREKHEVSENMYHTIFSWCKKHDIGFHPMVAACNIDSWIQNYDWWVEITKQYYPESAAVAPCMLEVRNGGDWTPEKVNKYLQLLDHIINYRLSLVDNDIKHFAAQLFVHDVQWFGEHGLVPAASSIDPIVLRYIDTKNNYKSCSLGFSTCISLYDLSLLPCHRLAYPQFRGGRFIKDENNKITGIEALPGMDAYFNFSFCNPNVNIKCSTCPYNGLCIKGCLGAQYEWSKDPLLPIDDVCYLYKRKINYLVKRYQALGIWDYVKSPECIFTVPEGTLATVDYLLEHMEELENGQ